MKKTDLQYTHKRFIRDLLTRAGALALIFALGFLGFGFILTNAARAQTSRLPARRINDNQVEQIIRSIERRSDVFRQSFDAALDRSRLNGTYTEDSVNGFIKEFETATDNLRSRFNGRTAVTADVDNVLSSAAVIDRFMRTNLRQAKVQGDWSLLRSDLERLARAYNVAFNLNGRVLPPSVVAGARAYRVSDAQVETLLRRLETAGDKFRMSLNRALDASRFDNTNREDKINEFVTDFENSTDELRRKFDGRTSVDADVSNVLVRAARIDDFMQRKLSRAAIAQRDWKDVRADLNLLSNYYSLAFNLDNRRNMPVYTPMEGVLTDADARFTGTYRLNTFESDNARTVAGNATRYASRGSRDRIYRNLVKRLTAPGMLAVERQGRRVTMASTVAPKITLDVDNREHLERYPNGRPAKVRASFDGNTLTIVSNGDRPNDFTAMFTSRNEGRRMVVTRRVFAEGLNQAIEVRSYYDRTSDTALFSVVNNNSVFSMNNNFLVPDKTILVAVLNTALSTKTVQNGDRFAMTIRRPAPYAGATIEGTVTDTNRSGRITGRSEMTLNYETIRLKNGIGYRFSGITQAVQTNSGENVRLDNEGAVREGDSRTSQTIERTAIGTGVGAILGAVLGGGKGALIGAAVGAGAGAGSVYIQGRDDLELANGTEFTIRASAPRNN